MLPSLFSVFLDYKCNFWCEHCSVGSSPKTVFPMPREVLDRLYDGLQHVPTASVVVFTGGECTLREDMLEHGIRRAKALGLVTRIVTNGWWARSPEAARRWVEKMKGWGLQELNSSFDDYHAPFIKLQQIAYLIAAGLDAGMRIAIGVIVDKTARWNAETVRAELANLLHMSVDELIDRVTIIDDHPTPVGTGEALDVAGLDAGQKVQRGCTEVLKTISIHPDGQVKACCGHAMFYQADLVLGNLMEEDLLTILQRGQRNLLYWWIHSAGPARILEQLGVRGQWASICHACQVLLRDHREELLQYLKEHKATVLARDIVFNTNLRAAAATVLEDEPMIIRQLQQTAIATAEARGQRQEDRVLP